MTDDMLRAVAKNGGVVQANFFSAFIDENYRKANEAKKQEVDAAVKAHIAELIAAGKPVTYLDKDRDRAGVGGEDSAPAAQVPDRPYRPHRQGRRSRSRRAGLRLRRRQRRHAGRH